MAIHFYGATNGQEQVVVKPPAHPRQRMRMNVIGILVSFFVPWGLFCLLYAFVSFRLHYANQVWCWILVSVAGLAVLGIGAAAVMSLREYLKGNPKYNPTWYLYLFLACAVAMVLGPVLGNNNFWTYMQPYYNLANLYFEYTYVDPTRMRGEQMMDAGRVQFLPEVTIDFRKAYAFQNLNTYCVAPITMYSKALGSPTPLFSYDFWAVGMNCCGGNSTHNVNFECGAYRSKTAREGLRLVADDQRSFFRLAVQQAEAAHMITSTHPLFFSWTEDAELDFQELKANAYKWYATAIVSWFLASLVLMMVAAYCLSKMGYFELLAHRTYL